VFVTKNVCSPLKITGYKQTIGAVSIGITIETAPFFCVCPVFFPSILPQITSQTDMLF
jgi:hypothetical protein